MDHGRIAALLEPFLGLPGDRRLSTDDLDKISTYIDLLLRWNARINLTAVRDPEQIVPRHFGESLFLARHLFPGANVDAEADRSQPEAQSSKRVHVVDLGSGAGFPALPTKIWAPQIHLTMIESNQKKATFLREVARALTLTNVDIIPERAESIAARLRPPSKIDEAAASNTIQPAEVVTFRAVEKFDQLLDLATKFLTPNARLAVLITTPQLSRVQTIPAMTWNTIHVPKSHTKMLAIGSKKWP